MDIRQFFYFTALASLIIWILVVGKVVIVPIVVAVLLAYVLAGATDALSRVPFFRLFPVGLRYMMALTVAAFALAIIGIMATENLRSIAQAAPDYQDRIALVIAQGAGAIGIRDIPSWETVQETTLARIDIAQTSLNILGGVASSVGYIVLVVTYVVFLLIERVSFARKLDRVLPDDDERMAAREVIGRINRQVITYLSTKTLVNLILGVISFILMWILGIENAVFWAFLIALFNYIPYVGSLIGVGIVVIYVMLETATLRPILLTAMLLTLAQVYVGNWLEPRVMSRSLNLSPFVVMVALVFWASIWGLIGAIIAVPMTSVLMIVLSSFEETRPIPIMLSRDGEI